MEKRSVGNDYWMSYILRLLGSHMLFEMEFKHCGGKHNRTGKVTGDEQAAEITYYSQDRKQFK